jgi:hypothetical protein
MRSDYIRGDVHVVQRTRPDIHSEGFFNDMQKLRS